MKMKTSLQFIVGVYLVHVASAIPLPSPVADPGRLLRVPRIYNALITSDAKLQPSRAFPYSTPVFQPLGLGPVPGFFSPVDGELLDAWQPQDVQPNFEQELTEKPQPAAPAPSPTPTTKTPSDFPKKEVEEVIPKSQREKTTHPLTFYPRSLGYYHPHPFIPYSYPLGPQPFVFGGHSGFNEQLYQYPNFGYDGYFGGSVFASGFDQVGGGYEPSKAVEQPTDGGDSKKNEAEVKQDDVRSKSDDIGIRELEFLADDEPKKQIPDSEDAHDDAEKHTDKSETT